MEYTYTYPPTSPAQPPPSFLYFSCPLSIFFIFLPFISWTITLFYRQVYWVVIWNTCVCWCSHSAQTTYTKVLWDPRWSSYFFYASNVSLWSAKNPPPGTSTRGAKTHLLEIDVLSISLFSVRFFFFWVCETDRHTRQREVIIWSRGTSTHRMGDIMMNKVQRREWGSKGHTSASSSVHPCGSEEEKRNKFREGDRLYVQPAANSGRRRGGGGFKREEKRA